jgi:putative oxidoreductase
MFDRISHLQPQALALLRIMSALLLIPHGTQKLFGFPSEFPYPLNGLLTVAAVLEVAGGLLLLVGFLSRPVAFVLSGFAAAAYFIGHASQGFYPINNGGDLAILFSFVYLYLFVAGPGAWSVDGALGRDSRQASAA